MSLAHRGRLAPSTTGGPHMGTMVSALLAWCAAKAAGGQLCLRFEDLDPDRARPIYADKLRAAFAWLGLSWDAEVWQSQQGDAHAAALDVLAGMGRLYACGCSRSSLRARGKPAPDGSWAYDNRCRRLGLGPGQWRDSRLSVRVMLPDHWVCPRAADGQDLSHRPRQTFGDPVVRRRDQAIAYTLAVVIDDAAWGTTDVVRGRDLAVHTATQLLIAQLLALPEPSYRHHFLLRHDGGEKLAKSRGDGDGDGAGVGPRLLATGGAAQYCGHLAHICGLQASAAPCRPSDLVAGFAWHKVRQADLVVAS